MIILVIGNGFDLAHGLPTKYTDFLKFAMVMHQVVDRGVPNDRIDYGKLTPAIVDLLKQNMHTLNIAEWKDLIYENLWIKYFLRNPMYAKENWIDFESEISKVIKQLDYDMFSTEGERKSRNLHERIWSYDIFTEIFLNLLITNVEFCYIIMEIYIFQEKRKIYLI